MAIGPNAAGPDRLDSSLGGATASTMIDGNLRNKLPGSDADISVFGVDAEEA